MRRERRNCQSEFKGLTSWCFFLRLGVSFGNDGLVCFRCSHNDRGGEGRDEQRGAVGVGFSGKNKNSFSTDQTKKREGSRLFLRALAFGLWRDIAGCFSYFFVYTGGERVALPPPPLLPPTFSVRTCYRRPTLSNVQEYQLLR
jgi:hypothetical protein